MQCHLHQEHFIGTLLVRRMLPMNVEFSKGPRVEIHTKRRKLFSRLEVRLEKKILSRHGIISVLKRSHVFSIICSATQIIELR